MTSLDTERRFRDIERRIDRGATADVSALYLPWSQRVLNPFPLASSGGAWGDSAQPWTATILAFYCSVHVAATNNGTNFWTIALKDSASTTLASFTTSAIAANTWVRFEVTTGITQPGSTNPIFTLVATATLSPGAIYIAPGVALSRDA